MEVDAPGEGAAAAGEPHLGAIRLTDVTITPRYTAMPFLYCISTRVSNAHTGPHTRIACSFISPHRHNTLTSLADTALPPSSPRCVHGAVIFQ
jgi:hypothetical protein